MTHEKLFVLVTENVYAPVSLPPATFVANAHRSPPVPALKFQSFVLSVKPELVVIAPGSVVVFTQQAKTTRKSPLAIVHVDVQPEVRSVVSDVAVAPP
jgi:hypothetical protein